MEKTPALTVSTLRELLAYDPSTGFLVWLERPLKYFKSEGLARRWNGRYAGHRAMPLNTNGYRSGYILRIMHRGHHVAWALHYGEWPPVGMDIDHLNGDTDDNRIANLRLASRSENSRNGKLRKSNVSGVMGVRRKGSKWVANIFTDGKQLHLGMFATIEEAAKARAAANARFGYHPNHGMR